jgi:hypothetical protein
MIEWALAAAVIAVGLFLLINAIGPLRFWIHYKMNFREDEDD